MLSKDKFWQSQKKTIMEGHAADIALQLQGEDSKIAMEAYPNLSSDILELAEIPRQAIRNRKEE